MFLSFDFVEVETKLKLKILLEREIKIKNKCNAIYVLTSVLVVPKRSQRFHTLQQFLLHDQKQMVLSVQYEPMRRLQFPVFRVPQEVPSRFGLSRIQVSILRRKNVKLIGIQFLK